MNDERYVYVQDVKDRKVLSRNARYKKNGSKSKKCTLPSDYMTKKEKINMNGDVKSYTLNEKHTWEELKLWPEDLTRNYMRKFASMNCSNAEVAKVLGVSTRTVTSLFSRFNIYRGRGRQVKSPEQVKAWLEFTGFATPAPEPEPQPEPEPSLVRETWSHEVVETVADAMKAAVAQPKPEPQVQTVCEGLEVVFTGTLAEVMKAVALLPIGKGRHRITVKVE